MSTILKALRRLEEDRNAQSRRPLREEVAGGGAPTEPPRRGWPVVAAVLALGVFVGAGALAFWRLSREGAPTTLAAVAPAEPAAPAAVYPPVSEPEAGVAGPPPVRPSPSGEAAPSAGASARGLSPAALASSVEVVNRPPAGPRIADLDADEGASGGAAAPTSRVRRVALPRRVTTGGLMQARGKRPARPAGAEPSGEAPGPPASWPEPPSANSLQTQAGSPGAAPAREHPPEPPVRRAEAEAAPPQEPDAPPPVKSAIASPEVPIVTVERTLWHPFAGRRTAVIELEGGDGPHEIREGDAVGPLVVSEIEPSGVVFVHEGVEFRRRVGD